MPQIDIIVYENEDRITIDASTEEQAVFLELIYDFVQNTNSMVGPIVQTGICPVCHREL